MAGTEHVSMEAEIAECLQQIRGQALQTLHGLQELERKVIARRFNGKGATTAILGFLEDGPRTRSEIVSLLADCVRSGAKDRRRSVHARLGQLVTRNLIREEGDMLALA